MYCLNFLKKSKTTKRLKSIFLLKAEVKELSYLPLIDCILSNRKRSEI